MPEWIDQPYVRVYLSMAQDHPRVWRDPALLGWWLRCLVAADRYHPAPAPIPPGMPDLARATLEDDGVLEALPDDEGFFRFHGLAALRALTGSRGRIGGLARAREAERVAGRFVGRNAGQDAGASSLVNAGGPRTNGTPDAGANSLVEPAGGTVAGHQRTSLTTDIQTKDVPSSRPSSVVQTPPPARAGARGAPKPPDDADCSDPVAHAISHTYYPGVGWRCLACQQNAQIDDSESFRSKVERHGGPQF